MRSELLWSGLISALAAASRAAELTGRVLGDGRGVVTPAWPDQPGRL